MSELTQLNLFNGQHTATRSYESSIIEVSRNVLPVLWQASKKLHRNQLRAWMKRAFGGSDTDGIWDWKDVYEAQECAVVMLLAHKAKAISQHSHLDSLHDLAQMGDRLLTHTRRSEESVELQQFSTPPQLAYLTVKCAGLTSSDLVLEPSAGTGILARFCEVHGANVVLNELSDRRQRLLKKLFPGRAAYGFNAEQIHDFLPHGIRPSVVVMNPPFSATPNVNRRNPQATGKHVRSAFLRLMPGGRLVLISGHWFAPGSRFWEDAFRGLSEIGVRVTATIPGKVYAKHGTTVETRLTVIDKVADDRPMREFVLELDTDASVHTFREQDITALLKAIPSRVSVEIQVREERPALVQKRIQPSKSEPVAEETPAQSQPPKVIPLTYELIERPSAQPMGDSLYEVYQPQRIRIHGAKPHPTTLCESGALASVRPPAPSYQPLLPTVIAQNGLLSEAQLESVIYAGEAHAQHLSGFYVVDASFDTVEAASSDTPNAVQFRRGWFLGDGTGAGKGRQVAGIILDNWCQGRTKALWVSKSDKLVEDARRDWMALGGHESEIIALSRCKMGQTIAASKGILFTTYATLRSGGKPGQRSRLQQIIEWLGADFEGVIAFDEAHAMGNAIAEKSVRGLKRASQQGLSGLRLQNALPNARVVYVSATGATKISNLAYATRLGLWQTGDFPFPCRSDFMGEIESGGVAAMEVVCRDLKALGLYFARNLSFAGVEYEALEIPLTPEQVSIYDTYAEAFQVIHTHIEAALQACGINGLDGKTLNRQAKMAAMSVFESHKQRFFNHLITSMKCPSLIRAIEADLEAGQAVVIQVVSTNEEMMKRRLAEIPTEEWQDLSVDITPREYLMDYLVHAFPIHLYEPYTTEDGNLESRMVMDAEGNPVICQEALANRDALIARIAELPPLPGALDQLLHHFGHDQGAEVTGRSQRILKEPETGRLFVSARPASANLDEAQSFMDDEKSILIFSDAGGTGRSYHADLCSKNIRRRVHYLLEAGWRADNAIQGLGRSHRTNQASAPIFRPVVTDVRGERRFISTIARRLDSLGALTRGQRQTGGQGLFKARDNLESVYAEAALRQFFTLLYQGQVSCCSLAQFELATGLSLKTESGQMKEQLPNIRRFLNRLLALPIQLQNELFEFFEMLLETCIEGAIAAGTYEAGVETLQAERFQVLSRKTVYTHKTGGETICVEIEETQRTQILSADEAQSICATQKGVLMLNERSHRAAVKVSTTSTVNEQGAVISRVSLIRPANRERLTVEELQKSTWRPVSVGRWQAVWEKEVADTSPFSTRRFFLICGLLLPIWNSLDSENMQVFRLQADDGERLLGRMVEPQKMSALAQSLGLQQVDLSATEIYQMAMQRGDRFSLPGGLALKPSVVMGETRLEIVAEHIAPALCEQLKVAGCFTEIISWKRRVFVPTVEAQGIRVIEKVMALLK